MMKSISLVFACLLVATQYHSSTDAFQSMARPKAMTLKPFEALRTLGHVNPRLHTADRRRFSLNQQSDDSNKSDNDKKDGDQSSDISTMKQVKTDFTEKKPIRKTIKKLLPLGLMLFCILFNYTILRDTKDVLVVTAPNSGAEIIPFLKVIFADELRN